MKLLIILSFIAVFALNAQDKNVQDKVKTVVDEKSGKPMLVGVTDRSAFQDTSYSKWFNPEYDKYRVRTKELSGIADKIRDYNIIIVMGTWCSDSHREVPRFYKILDSLSYPEDKIKLIMVDKKRKDLSGEVDSLNVQAVPSIIFYKDGKEEGRIIEAPKETLEKDTYNIVMGVSDKAKDENESKEAEQKESGGK